MNKFEDFMFYADLCIQRSLACHCLGDDKMSEFYYNASNGFKEKALRLQVEETT